jgi:hypothetical protein
MDRQSEHDAVGAALAAYEHALDVYDRMVYGGAATDREITDAQDDVDNLAELVAATRQAKGTATSRLVVSPPELPAETAWLRDVTLEW